VDKKRKKLGPVTVEERRAYLRRLGSDRKYGRPEDKTAKFVWELSKDDLPCKLGDLLPKSKARPSGADNDRAVLIAQQSLVVALDCAIAAGHRGSMLTKNLLFDALASRWSRRYQRVTRKSGARVSYDMCPATVKRAIREFLFAGVRFDTLWAIVTRPWSRTGGANPFYSVSRVAGRNGHPLGWRVEVGDSLALRAFESAVQDDGQYHRRYKQRLLLTEDWKPRRRPVRQKVCEERAYNVVTLGERSDRVLSILEQTQVRFNVEAFRQDYEAVRDSLRTSTPWHDYRKARAFVHSYRNVYERTGAIPTEVVEYPSDEDSGYPGGTETLPRQPWIRSRFFRASNRRYHASNFWPENVPKEFRDKWFSTEVYAEPDDREVPAHPTTGRYVERDIVTSQI